MAEIEFSELWKDHNREARIAELEVALTNARKLLQISDERVTRLYGRADELEDSNHHLGEENYILTGRIAELEAALKDALWASDVIDGKVCGCGFVEPKDYDEYKEAQERIQKAQAVAGEQKPEYHWKTQFDCHKI